MLTAAQIGLPMSEFWDMTPYELGVCVKGYAERQKQEFTAAYKIAVLQAYYSSSYVWTAFKGKRINLKKHLNAMDEKKPQTLEDMLKQIEAMNRFFGGTVVNE